MKRGTIGALAVGLMLTLSACVDPNDAAQRAVAGAGLGATLGAGLGAAFAINPGLGAAIGAAGGGVAGAVVGAATTPPPITYGPVPPAQPGATIGFYDTWPPGYDSAAPGHAAPPPPAHAS